ncbi:MAG: hypothetical protein WCJ93_04400 [Methanomicrobiales archaeon]
MEPIRVPKNMRRPFPKLPLYTCPSPLKSNEATAAMAGFFSPWLVLEAAGTACAVDKGFDSIDDDPIADPQFSQNWSPVLTLAPQFSQKAIEIPDLISCQDMILAFRNKTPRVSVCIHERFWRAGTMARWSCPIIEKKEPLFLMIKFPMEEEDQHISIGLS